MIRKILVSVLISFMLSAVSPAAAQGSSCGDGMCDPLEDCNTCLADCPCTMSGYTNCVDYGPHLFALCIRDGMVCGDGSCDIAAGENCILCPSDCGACNSECSPHMFCRENSDCLGGLCTSYEEQRCVATSVYSDSECADVSQSLSGTSYLWDGDINCMVYGISEQYCKSACPTTVCNYGLNGLTSCDCTNLCGNSICESFESCKTCSVDCGACTCSQGEQCKDDTYCYGGSCINGSCDCGVLNEFDDIQIIDNGDGTYDYIFVKDGVPIIELEGNTGLIDLSNLTFSYVSNGKTGISIGNLTLNGATKSITLRKRPKLCAVDDPLFIAEDHIENWDCLSLAGRITWASQDGNKCEGSGPVQAKDKDGNWLSQYTCEAFTLNGTNYVKMSGFSHTSVIGTEIEDSDGDGVNNEDDLCPETTEQAEIDSDGCSANQFCGKIDIPERGKKMAKAISKCNFADWKDDERRPPGDCHARRTGTGKNKNFECVVKERAK